MDDKYDSSQGTYEKADQWGTGRITVDGKEIKIDFQMQKQEKSVLM